MIVGSEDSPEVAPYPVRFEVEWPERQSRWKALFRIPLVIPALLFATLVLYVAFLALPVMWIAILVRGRIPRWLFDFEVGANRFYARTQAYLSLLTDVYPAFDGPYPVSYGVAYPDRVSRWQVVIWKFATSLPHWIVVSILQYAAFALAAVGWLAILFTGQFPKGLHTFIVGVMRWRERVYAYTLSLTDEFPPYSIAADAPAATRNARTASAAAGVLVVGGLIAGIVAAILTLDTSPDEQLLDVSYERLLSGEIAPGETLVDMGSARVELVRALDPADADVGFLSPEPGYRLVLVSFLLTNETYDLRQSGAGDLWLEGDNFVIVSGTDGDRVPILAVIGRHSPPVFLDPGKTVPADVVFEVPLGVQPDEVSFTRIEEPGDSVHYRFR